MSSAILALLEGALTYLGSLAFLGDIAEFSRWAWRTVFPKR